MSRLYRRNDSPNWYYTDGTGRNRLMKSTGTANRRIAELIRTRWDEQRILERHGILSKKMTCNQLRDEYVQLVEKRKSESRVITIKTVLRQFCKQYGDSQIGPLTVKDINDYVSYRVDQGKSPKTVREDISITKTMFRYAIENGYINANPCDLVMLPEKRLVRPRKPIPPEMVKKAFDLAWREDDRLFWMLLYYSGLRVGDAGTLQEENIVDNTIKLDIQTKTGEPVRIPLHKDLISNKKRLINLMPTVHRRNASRERFQKILNDNFGLKSDLHSLRHSFNTHLRDLGLGYEDRKALLGHKAASRITADYTHTNNELLKLYIDRL